MVGAIDGCSINLDGSGVEIYKYDLTDPGQKTIINEAKKKIHYPVLEWHSLAQLMVHLFL